MDSLQLQDETIVEIALIHLAFARSELAVSDLPSDALQRAIGHIETAICGLASLAPDFVRLRGATDRSLS